MKVLAMRFARRTGLYYEQRKLDQRVLFAWKVVVVARQRNGGHVQHAFAPRALDFTRLNLTANGHDISRLFIDRSYTVTLLGGQLVLP